MKTKAERITKAKELLRAAAKPYAWPGGYPMFSITEAGDCICNACLLKDFKRIVAATLWAARNPGRSPDRQYTLAAVDVNWGDGGLYCDECSERIESAYAEGGED